MWTLLIKCDHSCEHDALVISAVAVLSSAAGYQLMGSWWANKKSVGFTQHVNLFQTSLLSGGMSGVANVALWRCPGGLDFKKLRTQRLSREAKEYW